MSWTTIHLPTVPGVRPPFTLAEVELVEQPGLIIAALIGEGSQAGLATGVEVEMGFSGSKANDVRYPEFRVIGQVSAPDTQPGARVHS